MPGSTRCAIFFGQQNYLGPGPSYLKPAGRIHTASGVEPGYTMPRDGSIIGFAICVDVLETPPVTVKQTDFVVSVDDGTETDVWTLSINPEEGGGGSMASPGKTQAAGIDTFSAGDVIRVNIEPNNAGDPSVGLGYQPTATVIVEFDS